MNKVICVVIATVLIFTGVVLWFNYRSIQAQDTPITAFFSLFAAELATMGGIKIKKIHNARKSISESINRGTINRERRYDGFEDDEQD